MVYSSLLIQFSTSTYYTEFSQLLANGSLVPQGGERSVLTISIGGLGVVSAVVELQPVDRIYPEVYFPKSLLQQIKLIRREKSNSSQELFHSCTCLPKDFPSGLTDLTRHHLLTMLERKAVQFDFFAFGLARSFSKFSLCCLILLVGPFFPPSRSPQYLGLSPSFLPSFRSFLLRPEGEVISIGARAERLLQRRRRLGLMEHR